MAEKENAAGKGRPTPSRKTQERANVRPLVGAKSPEAKKADREQVRIERAKARAGMAAGDDKYLTARDRGPQKRFVRDFVDSKFTFGELVMPTLFVVILLSAVDSYAVQIATLGVMWTLFLAVGINGYIIGKQALRQLEAKHGASRVESGIKWYAIMRSIQMRPMRLPKPQVKRGAKVSA